MYRTSISGLLAIVLLTPWLPAQENTPAPAAAGEADRSIMSNPRLKNVLRTVRQEAEPILEEAAKDPSEAVREATRLFKAKADSIDADKLKDAAAEVRKNGAIGKTIDEAKEAIQKDETLGKTIDEAKKVVQEEAAKVPVDDPAALPPDSIKDEVPTADEMATPSSGPQPVAIPTDSSVEIVTTPISPSVNVPATRPAPGISGGVPTPIAMPADTAATSDLPIVATPTAPSLPEGIEDSSSVVQKAPTSTLPGTSPTIPELPNLGAEKVPPPTPLTKKYGPPSSSGAYPTADKKHMEILSKESTMDNAKGILQFTGNVFIDHPEFEIKCDKLEIQLAENTKKEAAGTASPDKSGAGNFKRAIASGGMVEIKRTAVDDKGKRKTQIAIARIADYNAITKDIVLTGGPPYIQDGESFVKTNSEDAKIIMHGNGLYEITGSTNRSQIVIPIENKEGDNKKGNIGISGGLDKTFNRMR